MQTIQSWTGNFIRACGYETGRSFNQWIRSLDAYNKPEEYKQGCEKASNAFSALFPKTPAQEVKTARSWKAFFFSLFCFPKVTALFTQTFSKSSAKTSQRSEQAVEEKTFHLKFQKESSSYDSSQLYEQDLSKAIEERWTIYTPDGKPCFTLASEETIATWDSDKQMQYKKDYEKAKKSEGSVLGLDKKVTFLRKE